MQINIDNVTDAKITQAFSAIRNKGGTVNDAGFNVKGIVGTYSRAGNRLTINIMSKPWYIPEAVLESKLREFFK